MTIVAPTPYTIKSTNVPLQDYTEYSPDTTYNKGSKCTVLADKKNYYCLENNTKGKEPKTNSEDGGVWISEPINAYALFNSQTSKKTKNQGLIEFTISTNEADTIALFGVDATEVTFEYTKNNQVIFSETKQMVNFEINSLYDYFFPKHKANKICISQPDKIIYFGVDVKVSIKSPSSTASCLFFFAGRSTNLGVTIKNGKLRSRRFGEEKRDIWGNLKKQNGNLYNIMEVPIVIDNNSVENAYSLLLENADKLCVYIADNEGYSDMTTIYGTYEELEFPFSNFSTQYTLKLEAAYGTNIKN